MTAWPQTSPRTRLQTGRSPQAARATWATWAARAPWAIAMLLLAGGAAAQEQPADFAWRATLEAPAGASLARVRLPAEALARLQSARADDLRVFDADGRPVPFALTPLPPQPGASRPRTPAFNALPLYSASANPSARAPAGSVQIRVHDGAQGTAWVRLTPAAAEAGATDRTLPAALFDARASRDTLSAIVVDAQLRPNAPVRVSLFASTDLAQWEPVPLRGRLYRFEGADAPANDTLELASPLALQGRYLRLDWEGQDGVAVRSLTGLIAAAAPPAPRESVALPAARAEGATALEWELRFATPLAGLALSTSQPNVLLPVRVLGRDQPSQPWRLLGQTVVWRLGSDGAASASGPLVLAPASVRWLRLEATHGMRLDAAPLAVSALLDPLELVFVAGGRGPHVLAAGRPQTPAAALPLAMIAAAHTGRIEDLPAARLTQARAAPEPVRPAWLAWLPASVDTKTAVLWAVLLAGVAVLGAAAWALLRQLGRARGDTPPG